MDVQLVKKGLDYKKKLLLLLAACTCTGYGLYRFYHLPVLTRRRKKVLKLLGALFSIAEAISDSAETIGVVSSDLRGFLQSESDQIPNSFKQISKIVSSKEFSGSVANVTQALTVGILRGYKFHSRSIDGVNGGSSFMDNVMDRLSTPAGSGFASVVVGSFARNLVMAFYSGGKAIQEWDTNLSDAVGIEHRGLEENSFTKWVNVVCSNDKCRELIGDCIQSFVSTAVAIYLDRSQEINTYDEFFAGLTNPKHEREVKDVLISVCNGAVEILVKTSHQVLTSSNSSSSVPYSAIEERGETKNEIHKQEALSTELKAKNSSDDVGDRGWVEKVSSILAGPSNRRFVLDLTGRITFEMVRSFLEILLEKIHDALKRFFNVVRETVVDCRDEVVTYVTAKSSAIYTMFRSLCPQILDGVWLLVPI